jgi:hypothetical protein
MEMVGRLFTVNVISDKSGINKSMSALFSFHNYILFFYIVSEKMTGGVFYNV